MNQSKQVQYAALVADRKACHACSGLANPSTYAQGRYDSAEIGPWTRWQGNLDAKLMVVGQDWGDIVYFDRYNGLDAPSNPTNRALCELLNSIGIKIDQHSLAAGRGQIFLTNAILCLKTGGMQGTVASQRFCNCGSRFLRTQIEIVWPKVVVGLGRYAYRAVLLAYRLRPGAFRVAVESPTPVMLPGNIALVPVYHCGQRVINTHRCYAAQLRDWQRVHEILDT
jgi:uracil-DNA glycosylase family 4